MAIIFEEKSNLGKNIVILIFVIALLAAGGFWLWNFLQTNEVEISDAPAMPAGINLEVLQDPNLASLEVFPEITPMKIDFTNRNPFVEYVPADKDSGGEE